MAARKTEILPQTQLYLQVMGEQIKLARLRRKLPAQLVADTVSSDEGNLFYYISQNVFTK